MKEGDLISPVYRDERGEIRRYDINGSKFNVLITKPGIFRSGDFHPVKQFDLILKGRIKITLREDDKDIVVEKKANEFIAIPPNIPHLFYFTEETVMLEWWGGEFKAKFYKPYREKVLKQFS